MDCTYSNARRTGRSHLRCPYCNPALWQVYALVEYSLIRICIRDSAVPVHLVGRSRRVACQWFRIFSRPRRPVDLWDAISFYLWLLSRVRSPLFDSILSFLWSFGLFLVSFSLETVGAWGRRLCGFRTRTHCESLGCALDLLCILDLLSSLSALGHGKRRRIHGIDLTGGIYNGSDSVGGVGGFPFALASALDRGSLLQSARHCECNKKDCSVHILTLFPAFVLMSLS